MEINNRRSDLEKQMKLTCKLQCDAWVNMQKIATEENYSAEEMEFINGMANAAKNYYDNIDDLINKLLDDQAGLALMQAAMAPHIESQIDQHGN